MKKKRSKTKGFTIFELLVALLLVGLMGLVVSSGAMAATRVYRTSQQYTESNLLAADLMMKVENEVRYARDLETEGGEIRSFRSKENREETCFLIQEGRLYLAQKGHFSEARPFFAQEVYTNDLAVESLSIALVEEIPAATITLVLNEGEPIVSTVRLINLPKGER